MDLADHSRHAAKATQSRKRIQREGFTMNGKKVWTNQEDDVVRSMFPNYKAICRALPHRSYSGIRYRAHVLDLVTRRRPFTARELSIIRRIYPTGDRQELEAQLPGRDWQAIAGVATRNGIHRKLKPFKVTGVAVIDQIRSRCRELNYTMPDLDKLVKSKKYFSDAKWLSGHIHLRAIGRAVRVLFGDLKADWK